MKTLFVPGWMKSVRYYGEFEGLDIWKRDFRPADFCSVERIVAHSMGASYALAEESVGNANTKYFLINPMLVRKSFVSWLGRWTRFAISGGIKIDRSMEIGNIFSACRKAFQIARYDIDEVLAKIPKENVTIIRGRQDEYFCDSENIGIVRAYGFEVVEVDDLGHEWDERYKDVLAKLIK